MLDVATANAAGGVYGTLMVGILLAAESPGHETYGETVGAAAIVLGLYWLTSLYAHLLGDRLKKQESLNLALVRRMCLYELPIIEGALVPLVALLVAWAAGASLTTGIRVAVWTMVGTVVALEVAAGWRARLGARGVWLQAAAGATMGLAVVAAKLVLHG
ncbi:MAG: hypothetical protein JO153_13775 [Solirubrobacterales bacterium]|nr:hypothetical protein [Solirubrobacterales bacterium]